jgi:hypothetical protein
MRTFSGSVRLDRKIDSEVILSWRMISLFRVLSVVPSFWEQMSALPDRLAGRAQCWIDFVHQPYFWLTITDRAGEVIK